jgi:osmotically-inducible protein OsmY
MAPPEQQQPSAAPAPSETQTAEDRMITRNVHEALARDKSLSAHAKTIRITTVNGRVTLHGTVTSEKEKTAIENKVKAQPGVVSVDNLLEVRK